MAKKIKTKLPVEPIPDPVTIKAVKSISLEELRSKESVDAVSVFVDNLQKTHVKGFKIYNDIPVTKGTIYWIIKKGKTEQKVYGG